MDFTELSTKYPGLKEQSDLAKGIAIELKKVFPPERFKEPFKDFSDDFYYVMAANEIIEKCPKNLKLEIAEEGNISLQRVEETPEGFDGFVAEASKINLGLDAPPSLQEFLNELGSKLRFKHFIDPALSPSQFTI